MNNVRDFLPLIKDILLSIGIVLFLWGMVENYFLTRYGGKLNRGFTIWSQPLTANEQQFLENLKEDILDIKKRQFGLRTIIKKDFIVKDGNEALIRFNHMGQRTSWPLVGYVDLSLPEPRMEYRLSLPILSGSILIMFINIIIAVVLVAAFVFSWLFESGGLRNYLSQKIDLFFIKQNS
jgi:hypothetical protein